MNYFSKIRVGAWVVIILTTINIAILGTIFYKHFNELSREKMLSPKDRENRGFNYFMQELKLTPEQAKFFSDSRKEFFDSSKQIFKTQEELRLQLIKELSKADPDTTVLFKICDEMGQYYVLSKRKLLNHLLKCREVCTPEQRKKLDTLYHKLIHPEGPMGRGHRHEPTPPGKKPQQPPRPE